MLDAGYTLVDWRWKKLEENDKIQASRYSLPSA
jgi:hypothetical protein